jgi:hypothetical protein
VYRTCDGFLKQGVGRAGPVLWSLRENVAPLRKRA